MNADPRQRQDPLRRLPGDAATSPPARPAPATATPTRRPHRPLRPADRARPHAGGRRRRRALRRRRLGRRHRPPPALRHRHRRRHHLPRLQARALHRQPRGRGRRRRHRRHRGDLQLLRRQGEDRHRPPPRPRGAPTVRAGGEAIGHVTTAEYGSPDALARRRRAPDRRLQGRGPRHLRHHARALQPPAGRARHRRRRRADRRRPAGRRSSTASPRAGCVSAAARPRSACSPRSGRASSTRSSSSTTTSPASSPSTRPAGCSAGSRPASASAATARPRAATSASPSPATAGAAPASPTRSHPRPLRARKRGARPGLTLLMVSTTGEQHAYYVLDADARPRRRDLPAALAPDRRAHRRELRAVARDACSSSPAPAARCAPASPRTRCA